MPSTNQAARGFSPTTRLEPPPGLREDAPDPATLPRRLSEVHDFRAPNPSEADHSNLWIGVWESQFAFSDLELKPLDAADRAASQFTGVFPATPQSNVPLAIVRP
jgi:hypothetical protein